MNIAIEVSPSKKRPERHVDNYLTLNERPTHVGVIDVYGNVFTMPVDTAVTLYQNEWHGEEVTDEVMSNILDNIKYPEYEGEPLHPFWLMANVLCDDIFDPVLWTHNIHPPTNLEKLLSTRYGSEECEPFEHAALVIGDNDKVIQLKSHGERLELGETW